ncbi:RluA family pseudouridine synthase [Dictyobacter aurantiacus]|uniref:Pseudouridine synthase n=1 Tax=Dictyobacter aurantiacus TaxID=1936993 RepID=A0A401ZL27_9CHLR|nr:RluA family pseudouridine synthase [Dictyobacter aurantiacus]GCE07553.1 putative RNA pseudouridine synthase YlyB [Dictyobacter aurantiacus]
MNKDTTTPPQTSWTITEEHVGTRLDRFLTTQIDTLSRASIQQLVSDGAILINGKAASKSGYALRLNDRVQVQTLIPSSAVKNVVAQVMPLDIVYEDADLIVINKAAGMVVHPAPGHYEDTLVNALLARYPELKSQQEDLRPGIVHRLDRDTSGLLLVARNLQTQAALIEQMKAHQIEKRYLALVEGVVSLDRGSIDAPIGRDPRNRQQMTITSIDSKEAVTHFKVQERYQHHTLLLLQLETGRTHQIRVHLKAIGHPVVGDPTYGTGRLRYGITLHRQFLHAYQLRFTHPTTGATVELEAPLPEDLQSILDQPEFL